MLFDLLAKIGNQQYDASDSERAKKFELMMQERLSSHRQHRLGNRFSKRPHTRPEATSQNRSLKVVSVPHYFAVADDNRKADAFVGESPQTLPLFGLSAHVWGFVSARLQSCREGRKNDTASAAEVLSLRFSRLSNDNPLQLPAEFTRDSGRILAARTTPPCWFFCIAITTI